MHHTDLTYTEAVATLKALHQKLEADGHFKYSYLNVYMAILNRCEKLAVAEAGIADDEPVPFSVG